MSITLSDGTTTVNLSPDLYWSDEMSWSPAQQSIEPSITGALIVQESLLLAGRPVTLESEDGESGAISREVLEQLRNWAAVPGLSLTLTLRSVARAVIFRKEQGGGAIEATPWIHYNDVQMTDQYLCTLRFLEI